MRNASKGFTLILIMIAILIIVLLTLSQYENLFPGSAGNSSAGPGVLPGALQKAKNVQGQTDLYNKGLKEALRISE